jgi:hypothetical protein
MQPIAENQKDDGLSYRISNTINYVKDDFLPEHKIDVMLGEELNYSKSDRLRATARYLPKYIDPVSGLAMMNLGTADTIYTFDSALTKLSSFFGRFLYDYKGKYIASATFRVDGSSKFAPGNQWGFFPSLGIGWRVSDEVLSSLICSFSSFLFR